MPADFRRNLTNRHPRGSFNAHNASAEIDSFKTFFQFALGRAGTEYQDGFRIANTRDDRVVERVEMARKGSLAGIVRGSVLLWFIGTPERQIAQTAKLRFNI